MLPTERDEFLGLVSEVLAGYNRNAGDKTLMAWWNSLKDRSLPDVRKVLNQMVQNSTEMPTVARAISLLRDMKPIPTNSNQRLINPSKTTLLACRRHMEMFGRHQAAEAYGAETVNILDQNPKLGYTATDPQTYGGTLPDHIQRDIDAGIRRG